MGWIIAIAAVGALAWVVRMGAEPALIRLNSPATLARMLNMLIERGVHRNGIRGQLIVEATAHPHLRLVFEKVEIDGSFGIKADLKIEGIEKAVLERFQSELSRRGVAHSVGTAAGARTVSFECARDLGLAHVIAHLLFEQAAGLRLSRDVTAHFVDVLARRVPRLTG